MFSVLETHSNFHVLKMGPSAEMLAGSSPACPTRKDEVPHTGCSYRARLSLKWVFGPA